VPNQLVFVTRVVCIEHRVRNTISEDADGTNARCCACVRAAQVLRNPESSEEVALRASLQADIKKETKVGRFVGGSKVLDHHSLVQLNY
jgi:hypothetical protein